jgi:hypothetical protein
MLAFPHAQVLSYFLGFLNNIHYFCELRLILSEFTGFSMDWVKFNPEKRFQGYGGLVGPGYGCGALVGVGALVAVGGLRVAVAACVGGAWVGVS